MPEAGEPTATSSTKKNPITSIKVLTIAYNTDHRVLRDKRDDWRDAATADEQKWIAELKPEYRQGQNGDKAQPISHSWGERIGVRVELKVEPPDADPEAGTLIGESDRAELSFVSGTTSFTGGVMTVTALANAALPAKIDLINDVAVRWKVTTNVKTHSPCGESKHEIYVTAGKPMLAKSWPMKNNNGQDHNWVTAFRMKKAVSLTKGQSQGHDIVKKIWESYGGAYFLNANGNLNPWNLAVSGTKAQCMTICAFIESAAAMLGIVGTLVYCWPSFSDLTGSDVTKSIKAGHPTVWALASPTFRAQQRSVTSPPHSDHQQHSKFGGSEIVSMVDHAGTHANWSPGWNNYEATFRYTDPGGVTKYYGGGGPIEDTPAHVLDKVCAVIAWCYRTSQSMKTFCSPPGPIRWWTTQRTPWPPSTMDSTVLPG
jgi:hypothetical protein